MLQAGLAHVAIMVLLETPLPLPMEFGFGTKDKTDLTAKGTRFGE
jgi:hypothetical protein